MQIPFYDKFGLLIAYIFETTSSQNPDYNTRSKEATIVTDTLSKIKSTLMTFISKLKDEIINLKEIIIKEFKDDKALLASRVVKLEDKIKNLEIKNNNLNQYNCKNNVEVSGIPEVVSGTNLENTEVIIFNVIDVKISNSDIEAVIVLASRKKCCCLIYKSEILFTCFAQ